MKRLRVGEGACHPSALRSLAAQYPEVSWFTVVLPDVSPCYGIYRDQGRVVFPVVYGGKVTHTHERRL